MSRPDLIVVALSTFSADDPGPRQLLEASGVSFRIHSSGKRITAAELAQAGADATVIIAGVESYDAAMLDRLPRLRCISRCGVGVDAIDLAAARGRGIAVANTPLVPTQAVAELALAMFLSLSRNLGRQSGLMRERRWERVTGHLLNGRTVGLFGFGRIGRRVAQLCHAFGARVLVHDPLLPIEAQAAQGCEFVERSALLQQADIVSLHASKNPSCPVVIGAAELAQMKAGACLVNLARGEMVDEAALVEALRSGRLAGAALDVFAQEPYSGPLCDFPQVILTPHAATLTFETRVAMERECVENALRFLRGDLAADRRVV
jgi:D-3-phosphoglycerate dehydrogenase